MNKQIDIQAGERTQAEQIRYSKVGCKGGIMAEGAHLNETLPAQGQQPEEIKGHTSGHFYGYHTKPVQKSLEILDSFGGIEYVEGSSKPKHSFTPFTVKLTKAFAARATMDGNPFLCCATDIHNAARKAKQGSEAHAPQTPTATQE